MKSGTARDGGGGHRLRAAGCVLWRSAHRPPGIEIAVVHRPRYDDWSLPKGKRDRGEHDITTALRETREETGFLAVLGRELPTQSYVVDDRLKTVRYWAAQAVAPAAHAAFLPNDEVDLLEWLPPDQAAERLTNTRDGDLLATLTERPYRTVPIVVLRHAAAVPRELWTGPPSQRPLAAAGEAHARALVPLLAGHGLLDAFTSPATRCVRTLAPYASAGPGFVRPTAALAEDAPADAAVAFLRRLVEGGRGAVLCVHREQLASLLALDGGAGVYEVQGRGAGEPLLPGEFTVLHTAGREVVQADRYAPYR